MCTIQQERNVITRDNSILVIIDVQEKLMPAIAGRETVIANIVRLARFAKIVGIPVLVTEQEKLGPTVTEVREALPEAEPVRKVHFNCLSCHDFTDRLHGTGRKTLVLTGAEAHICVAQTAFQAGSGYAVHVVADAVSSRVLENKEIALRRMMQEGALITSTEMFIYEILGKAGTDEFKAVLPLVK
ncbi:MAG TPA: hydrolase [Syntrophorhabdaceae bacterium]|jgi:nicotinamidase-related amidase